MDQVGLAHLGSLKMLIKRLNKAPSSHLLQPGGHLPWVHHGYLLGANQIDLFMHFLGASRDGLVARRVDLDTISSSGGSATCKLI
jgi:hypothetical protein